MRHYNLRSSIGLNFLDLLKSLWLLHPELTFETPLVGLWAGTTSRVARAAQCGAGTPGRLWRSYSRSLISVPLKAISLEAETSLLSLNPQEVHTLSLPACLTTVYQIEKV